MFLYDEPQTEYDCMGCDERENRLGDVKYWFTAILDQIYGREMFNAENLEHYIEEACRYLNLKMPERSGKPMDLVITKKEETPSKICVMLDAWKEFNHQFLTDLGA